MVPADGRDSWWSEACRQSGRGSGREGPCEKAREDGSANPASASLVDYDDWADGEPSHRKAPLGRTVAAWKKLVKVWGALRFSDAANMKVKAVRFYDGKLTATLQKTKTTGAGKRVRELPLYISQEAYVSELAWLEIGYNLVERTWRDEGEYVFNEGAFDGPERSWAYEVLRGLSKQ